jgi:hypothetical protein
MVGTAKEVPSANYKPPVRSTFQCGDLCEQYSLGREPIRPRAVALTNVRYVRYPTNFRNAPGWRYEQKAEISARGRATTAKAAIMQENAMSVVLVKLDSTLTPVIGRVLPMKQFHRLFDDTRTSLPSLATQNRSV